MPALRILHFVMVFVIFSIIFQPELEKQACCSHLRKDYDKKNIFTNRVRGPYGPSAASGLIAARSVRPKANIPLKTKSIQLMTLSMETIRMAKSRPRESKASDFPQDYLDNTINLSMYIPSVTYNS